MKLITKYNSINIIVTVIILLLSSVVYYFFIRATLVHQLDKELKTEKKELKEYVKENNNLPEPTNYKDEQEEFVQIKNLTPERFFSVKVYDKEHAENIYYRQLEFAVPINDRIFKVIIRKSQQETEDLIKLILMITLAIVLLLLLSLFLINRFLFRKLWRPFTHTLHHLQNFDISRNQPLFLQETKIEEFTLLNKAVTLMTNKAVHDYNEIKNFTENASHEIQTPLAIIKSKLELLSQGDSLKEDQMDNIQSIFEACTRLSRLNQSLLLLTKIDNKQFNDSHKIDLSNIINRILMNYEELFNVHHISLQKDIQPSVFVKMNESLAEILISNLINNAIKHNNDIGFIKIYFKNNEFLISNSGKALKILPASLFERFMKEESNNESLGLGLSIVKKIIETYNFSINYTCTNNIHLIKIDFTRTSMLLQN